MTARPGTMKRLPFFLPMAHCPRRCVYCDQGEITGIGHVPSPDDVARVLSSLDGPREVCYFGGSFTCLPSDRRAAYLTAVLNAPKGSTVRFSTHPECITEQVLAELAPYPVSMVELGISSLDDSVLAACNRGYTAHLALDAMALVLARGFALCAQMMIGLPGQTEDSSQEDLRRMAVMKGSAPMTLRIYPCLVLENTPLARSHASGDYSPLSVDKAVLWAGQLLHEAYRLGFAVQRIGLQESESLARSVIAGPHHPAFGELTAAEALVSSLLEQNPEGPWLVDRTLMSQLTGHGKYGIRRLAERSRLTADCVERRLSFLPANEAAEKAGTLP